MNPYKKILLWISLIMLLLIISGVFISYKYADKIEKLVIEELNKNLNRPVSIKDVEFTIWSKFPKASVKISEVMVEGLKKEDLPFIKAKNIYLSFDFLSLFSEEILVNEIDIEEGQITVLINANGEANYNILKETGEKDKNKSILKIEHINLLDIDLSYINHQIKQEYQLYSDDTELAFSMGDKQQFVLANFDGKIKKIKVPGYLFQKSIVSEGNLELIIDEKGVRYLFSKGEINGQNIQLEGQYLKQKNSNELSFNIPSAEIEKLIPFFPKNTNKSWESYQAEGIVSLNGTIKTNAKGITSLSTKINLKNGIIQFNEKAKIEELNFNGYYLQNDISNFNTGQLELQQFNFSLGNNKLSGKGKVSEFNKLLIDLELKGQLDLAYLCENFVKEKFENAAGYIIVNTKINGRLMNLIEQKNLETFSQLNSYGDIELVNFGFSIPGQNIIYKNISGQIQFNQENIRLEQFKGTINSTQFTLVGQINNYLMSLMRNEALDITANVNAGTFKLEEFIRLDEAPKNNNKTYSFKLPNNLKLNLTLSLDAFNFRQFNAQNIKGKVKLNQQILSFDDLDFNSSDGKVNVKGQIALPETNRVLYEANLSLKGVNLKKLFTEMENFGQGFLLAKHLKGNLDTDIYFLAETDSSLNFRDEKIYTKADIKIKNGELSQFEPLLDLEKYLKDEFRINLSLSDLKFSNLANTIEIVNKVIYIPEMKIASNAIDLDVKGTHGFNQEINYLIKVKNSEIFKAKNNNPIEQKYGVIEGDEKSATLPILMSGTVDNPKFSYDVKTKKVIIKENLKEEKTDIKKAFQQEIKEIRGIKDTIPKQKPNKTTFQVEWEE